MKSKIIFSALVFITLIGMACVSAGDIDDFSQDVPLGSDVAVDDSSESVSLGSDVAVDDSSESVSLGGDVAVDDGLSLESISNQSDCIGESEEISNDLLGVSFYENSSDDSGLSSTKEKNLLGDDELTFTALAKRIQIFQATGNVNLIGSYTYSPNVDAAYQKGIPIVVQNNLFISGFRQRINGMFQAALFNIVGTRPGLSVTFSNMTFMKAGVSKDYQDCYEDLVPGGDKDDLNLFNAVHIIGASVFFYNCRFESNHCPVYGAIYAERSKVNIENCVFVSNTAKNGAAITSFSSDVEILSSSFTSNKAKEDGGQFI